MYQPSEWSAYTVHKIKPGEVLLWATLKKFTWPGFLILKLISYKINQCRMLFGLGEWWAECFSGQPNKSWSDPTELLQNSAHAEWFFEWPLKIWPAEFSDSETNFQQNQVEWNGFLGSPQKVAPSKFSHRETCFWQNQDMWNGFQDGSWKVDPARFSHSKPHFGPNWAGWNTFLGSSRKVELVIFLSN